MTDASILTTPVAPMLAKASDALPEGDHLYEPKWDGFRAIAFRPAPGIATLQSRELKPLDRWFPELVAALAERLPLGSVVDGEVVVATPRGLDFDALQQRIHPAASRIARLARETPASFVAFDLLAEGGQATALAPQGERRERLERLLDGVAPPVHLTPATRDLATARRWLAEFEGAGLDGVVAKRLDAPYQPGLRAMVKVKHQRTADCVVAGLRWHRAAPGAVGSLLLGLHAGGRGTAADPGVLHHVGITSSFTMATRHALADELAPLFLDAAGVGGHPWHAALADSAQRRPGAESRWSAGKDLAWQPLAPVRVCEVRYDHLQGDRFRHATTFLRWRVDKPPHACRYDQLETVPPYALARIFGGEG